MNYETRNFKLTDIEASEAFNCRGHINPLEVADLAVDIKENGLMQPVVVGPVQPNGKRILVAGYRRYMAFQINETEEIPALIRDDLVDEVQLLMMNMRENVQRKDLDLIQESITVKRFLDFGLTEARIMDELNMARGWVQTRCMICKLPEEIYPEIKEGIITLVNVRELYTSMLNDDPATFAANVRWIKERRAIGGKSVSLKKRDETKKAATGAKVRGKSEIFDMQERIQNFLGNTHFGAAALGWASGSLTEEAFEEILSRMCDRADVDYTPKG